jgi:hypothetical protein
MPVVMRTGPLLTGSCVQFQGYAVAFLLHHMPGNTFRFIGDSGDIVKLILSCKGSQPVCPLRTGLEGLTTPIINTYHVPKCCTEMKENEMRGTRDTRGNVKKSTQNVVETPERSRLPVRCSCCRKDAAEASLKDRWCVWVVLTWLSCDLL